MSKNLVGLFMLTVFTLISCKNETKTIDEDAQISAVVEEKVEPVELLEFGYNLNNYTVVRDTIKAGDSFGEILQRNNLDYPQIYNVVEGAKDSFDITKLQVGKPYTLLMVDGDSVQLPKCFIYQPNKIDYVVVDFADTTIVKKGKKDVTLVEREATGVIDGSLYLTRSEEHTSELQSR